jgi:hypothetical protein
MPFVQGHLRTQSLTVTFRTACAHCARPLQIDIDDRLAFVSAEAADPLIFLPLVDFEKLKDPSIIHAF